MSSLVGNVDGVEVPPLNPVRDIGRAIVQIATTWPQVKPWPTDMSRYLEPTSAEETWAPAMGQAELRETFGVLRQPDKPAFLSYGVLPDLGRTGSQASLLGKYAQICVSDETEAGTVTYDGATYKPIWHGVVIEAGRDTDGTDSVDTAGAAIWRCAGLGHLLEKVRPLGGHEVNAAGAVTDPGEILEFNKVAGGDRSASVKTIGAWLRSAYVHDRRGGNTWSALNVVEYLLYGHADNRQSEIRWDVAGQTGALNYAQHWDLRGLTLYQALVRVINARSGVSFRIRVNPTNGRPTLYINSTAPTPFTVDDDTTPANDAATPLVFAGDRWKDNVYLLEKEGLDYDEVVVQGQRPLITATLMYKPDGTGDLVKGWDTALESSWTATTKDPKYEHVYRRFKLRPDWNWTPRIGATNVPNARRTYPAPPEYPRSAANDAIYGDGGFVGGTIFQSSPVVPPWSIACIHFERLTGLLEGYDYKAIGLASSGGLMSLSAVDWSVSQLPPLVFTSTDSGSAWTDVSANYTVRCQSEAAAIILGNGITEAVAIKAAIASSSARLAFTISYRDPLPVLVSWKRPRAERPKDFPRRLVIPASHGDSWVIRADTIVGLTGTAPKQMLNSLTVVSQIPAMTRVLAAMRAWYSQPERELTWSEIGQVDSSAARLPGTMVTTAAMGDRTVTINGIVTRRAWDFTEGGWGTSYRVDRIKPDLEAIL